jgi:hypothetical protein
VNKKLQNIFSFLTENRQYNQKLQEKFYHNVLSAHSETKDKVISLLYHIANNQSQPNIDKLAIFYKWVIDSNCMNSFSDFVSKINPNKIENFNSLFVGMKKQDGWGEKTAALFTKSIYQLHNGNYSKHLKIWNDVPSIITTHDNFYLPVDSVIIAIFQKLDNSINWNFSKINSLLKEEYNLQKIEIWDDLWFWGFLTQNGSGINRKFEWNENKYWVLEETEKNPVSISKIKNKAQKFLKLL